MTNKRPRRILSLIMVCILALQLGGCAQTGPGAASGDTAQVTVMPGPEDPKPGAVKAVNLMADVTPNPAQAAPMSEKASAAAADFAVRLFRACYDGNGNALVSPLSVLAALAMTANGAKAETLAQMEQTLGLSRSELNDFFRAWMQALPAREDAALRPANSVWFTDDSTFTVNRDFLQTNADYFGADVYQAPFDDGTLHDINTWVSEKTAGMIPSILDEIPEDAVMYLINALAFEAKWAKPYNEYAVRSGTFTAQNGQKRTVDFMNSEEYVYLTCDGATGFAKLYKGGQYAFAALLPDEGVSVEELLASLDGAALQKMFSEQTHDRVVASLPKFEASFDVEISKQLSAMGMPDAFDSSVSDFSGLGASEIGNIRISRVLHKTFISVAEDGTRAGAATAVEMVPESAAEPEEPKFVILDRPFVYMLIDCQTNLPFFLGVMLDPAE